MFTKVQEKKNRNLWNCFSENHGMLLEREGAEYINAVHLIWGRLFIMKEKSYTVIGNHYLRAEDDIFCTFYYEFWNKRKVEISSQGVGMSLYGAAAQRALSSSFLCSGWGPCCAMWGPWFHLPHIKEMFPSVKNGSAMAVNQPIKILRRVTFPHALASVGHAPQSWSHLSPLPLPILSLQELQLLWQDITGWVGHTPAFISHGLEAGSLRSRGRHLESLTVLCFFTGWGFLYTLISSLRALISLPGAPPMCPDHHLMSPHRRLGLQCNVFGKETDTLFTTLS